MASKEGLELFQRKAAQLVRRAVIEQQYPLVANGTLASIRVGLPQPDSITRHADGSTQYGYIFDIEKAAHKPGLENRVVPPTEAEMNQRIRMKSIYSAVLTESADGHFTLKMGNGGVPQNSLYSESWNPNVTNMPMEMLGDRKLREIKALLLEPNPEDTMSIHNTGRAELLARMAQEPQVIPQKGAVEYDNLSRAFHKSAATVVEDQVKRTLPNATTLGPVTLGKVEPAENGDMRYYYHSSRADVDAKGSRVVRELEAVITRHADARFSLSLDTHEPLKEGVLDRNTPKHTQQLLDHMNGYDFVIEMSKEKAKQEPKKIEPDVEKAPEVETPPPPGRSHPLPRRVISRFMS